MTAYFILDVDWTENNIKISQSGDRIPYLGTDQTPGTLVNQWQQNRLLSQLDWKQHRGHCNPDHNATVKWLLQSQLKSVALQLPRAKTDWIGCFQMAVQGALWLAKRLSLHLNFSFLNWISLLFILSSYPIVLTMLGGPCSRPYTSRKISRV